MKKKFLVFLAPFLVVLIGLAIGLGIYFGKPEPVQQNPAGSSLGTDVGDNSTSGGTSNDDEEETPSTDNNEDEENKTTGDKKEDEENKTDDKTGDKEDDDDESKTEQQPNDPGGDDETSGGEEEIDYSKFYTEIDNEKVNVENFLIGVLNLYSTKISKDDNEEDKTHVNYTITIDKEEVETMLGDFATFKEAFETDGFTMITFDGEDYYASTPTYIDESDEEKFNGTTYEIQICYTIKEKQKG